jgi:PEP-CTERM motif
MLQKPFYFSLFLSLAVVVLAAPLKATETQIATLNITTTGPDPTALNEVVSASNLTSTTLNFQSFILYSASNPSQILAGPISHNISVGPYMTLGNLLQCAGGCGSVEYTLSGTLDSLDFSIGGQNFEATTLNFTTPEFSGDFNGILPVTIDATLVSTTPEPASVLLFGSGLLGILLLIRKSLLA